jgi:GT2 family glycosyltransferase
VLEPVLPGPPPETDAAVWVGGLDRAHVDGLTGRVPLDGAGDHRRARFLVVDTIAGSTRAPAGFVEVAVADGSVDAEELRAAVAALPVARSLAGDVIADRTSVTVVLCTYDRPDLLRAALVRLRGLDVTGIDLEVVVVDNHPAGGVTAPVVAEFAADGFRYVASPRQGLSRARNDGVRAARGEFVAFTDDDTLVDPSWVVNLVAAFRTAPDVVCVTGLVPSAELRSAAQLYFDGRVTWARSCTPDVYRTADVRPEDPMFPFQVGRYGTGANFALRRTAIHALGGFDERLGVGSATGGGEDIDMFVRVLLAGGALAYQPSAFVWHVHRASIADLDKQVRDYGRGLGAWLTTLVTGAPRTTAMVARRAAPALLHLRHLTDGGAATPLPPDLTARLAAGERAAVLKGPLALVAAARQGSRRPLHRP